MAQIISGKELAARIKQRVSSQVEELKAGGVTPCLAVVLVGDDPASAVYVRGKESDCRECGIESRMLRLPADTTQDQLLEQLKQLAEDRSVHGILVQLPLPAGLDEKAALLAISPDKDVDGLHPANAGALVLDREGFVPCTPKGVMAILKEAGLDDLSGKRAVVMGRSNLVGKPVGLLLQKKNATVTTIHSRTANAADICKEADILIAAIGKPEYVTKDFVKPGAVVIDVGINRVDGKLKGDVLFSDVEPIASVITPVPKGVGPMTVCMLLENTIEAWKKHEENK